MTPTVASLAGVRVIVTGATGFVGSAFVRHAVGQGARVTIVARTGADSWRLAQVAGQYDVITGSLRDLASLTLPLDRVDAFVHCAAAGVNQSFDDVEELVATNVDGTLAALTFAARLGVSRFVLAGSSGEYGPGVALREDAALHPTSEYGASRAAATLLSRAFGARRTLDVVVVRPFAVFGPYEASYRLVPYAAVQGLAGKPIRISSGEQTRDYLFVDDVAEGIGQACVHPAATGGVFNLCTGVETAVRDVVAQIAEKTGARSEVVAGARPAIPGEMWRTTGDPSRARDVLGWVPRVNLDEGLDRTIAWFRQEGTNLAHYAASTA
ncbi:MAG: NAD-dependent epimerase/dehydratase family protein [Gemmatimonadaceae bacterium]